MPTARHRPPDRLLGRVFTTEEALEAGVGRHLLSGPSYRSWGRGLWSTAEQPPDQRTRAGLLRAVEALQGEEWIVSHVSAARLLRFRLPLSVERLEGLHLSSDTGSRPRRAGVVGHRAVLDPADVWRLGAVRLTGPSRTLLDLASMRLRSGRPLLAERPLIAAVDGVINEHRTGIHAGRKPLRSRDDLVADADRFAGLRGGPRLRQALERCAVGVDSPMETYSRLILEDHGLTGWETDLRLSAPGHRDVWPDLADRRHRLSLQFDGAVHDEQRQRMRDVERERATEAAGWAELRVVSTDLETPRGEEPRIVALVRAHRTAFAAREGRRMR